MTRSIWIALALISAFLLWQFGTNKEGGNNSPDSDSSAFVRLEKLEKKLAHLSSKTDRDRTKTTHLARALRVNSEQAETMEREGQTQEINPVVTEVEENEALLAFDESLETAFAEEQADSAWSIDAADQAHDFMLSAFPDGSDFKTLECKGSLCRATITHLGESEHEAFVRELMHSDTPWQGPGSLSQSYDDDGTVKTVVFLGQLDSDSEEGSIWQAR